MGRYRVHIIYTHASTGHELVTVSLPQSEEYEKWRCWVRGFEFCGPPLGDEGTSTRSRNVPAIPAQKASFRIGFVQWVFDCGGGNLDGWRHISAVFWRISLASPVSMWGLKIRNLTPGKHWHFYGPFPVFRDTHIHQCSTLFALRCHETIYSGCDPVAAHRVWMLGAAVGVTNWYNHG